MVAANAATLATLELLIRGEAGHVDLSQLEAMSAHLGTALIDCALPPEHAGSGATIAPLTLRTSGEDSWLTVGRTPSKRFADAVAAVLDDITDDPVLALTEAAATSDADELAAALQQRGVPAYAVRDGRDLVTTDPQLTARGFYPLQQHPLAGEVQVEGIVAHLSTTPGRLTTPAPLLGQHSDELLEEVLGLDHERIRHLHDQGVLE
jgi:crotonobetainyl-CoA:carnitine CoA-transferase CaiB-like acyl-CoA transferase